MQDINGAIKEIERKFAAVSSAVDLEEMRTQIDQLSDEMEQPGFWDDKSNAQRVASSLSQKNSLLKQYREAEVSVQELREMHDLLLADNQTEELGQLAEEVELVAKKVSDLQTFTLLNGKYDSRAAIFTIRSGSGGTEAADWAKMLFRMYQHFFEKNSYRLKVLDLSEEEHGGIKSVTFEVEGDFVYGKLKWEAGTHRLVRISPFDHQNRRHTSFAAVEVIPKIESDDEVEIPEADVKVDVFRSSGPGGQSVNTTDSAVRLTHLPTGLVISMQNEKSQLQNKTVAFSILKSKLLELRKAEEAKEKKELAGDVKASWGDQVRNYVLNPFQLVKDVRTGVQTADAAGVLDGELNEFIDAQLRL
jgi:peptide chain release factor 2